MWPTDVRFSVDRTHGCIRGNVHRTDEHRSGNGSVEPSWLQSGTGSDRAQCLITSLGASLGRLMEGRARGDCGDSIDCRGEVSRWRAAHDRSSGAVLHSCSPCEVMAPRNYQRQKVSRRRRGSPWGAQRCHPTPGQGILTANSGGILRPVSVVRMLDLPGADTAAVDGHPRPSTCATRRFIADAATW